MTLSFLHCYISLDRFHMIHHNLTLCSNMIITSFFIKMYTGIHNTICLFAKHKIHNLTIFWKIQHLWKQIWKKNINNGTKVIFQKKVEHQHKVCYSRGQKKTGLCGKNSQVAAPLPPVWEFSHFFYRFFAIL